jgi:hypothetical protein
MSAKISDVIGRAQNCLQTHTLCARLRTCELSSTTGTLTTMITFTSSEGIRFVQCRGCGAGWPYIRPGVHMAMSGALETGVPLPLGYEHICTEPAEFQIAREPATNKD